MEYAGFWRRSLAGTIDCVFFVILYFVLDSLLKTDFFYINMTYQAICILYYVGMTTTQYQGTIGQIFLKVKIGDLHGNRLSLIQSIIRYILCALPAWPLIIYISLPKSVEIQSKLEALTNNQAQEEMVKFIQTPEFTTYLAYSGIFTGIMLIGGLIWMLSIGFSKQKAGIHDLIARQRAFKK